MRYQEFELTEDELFELSMSPTNLQKMAAQTGAQAGMEFEMIIPGATQDDNDYPDLEPDYDMDESFPTGRGWYQEVVNFFMNGDYGSGRSTIVRELDRLQEAYFDWKSSQFDDWLGNNSDVLFNTVRGQMSQQDDESDEEFEQRVEDTIANDGPEYDAAMEEMEDEFRQEDQWDDFLSEEQINTMQDFSSQYNLDWPYVTETGGGGGEISVDDVAESFRRAINRPVNASRSYHGGTREAGKYVVEPDSSLEGDSPGDGGLEFVSPPLPLTDMLSDLDKVAKWASSIDAYTNDSTGLHMNVSVPNFSQDKLDYVKLAIFLGDEYVLKQFGRQGNTYCKSAMADITRTARMDPDKVKTMLQQMQGNLSAMASKIVHTGSTSKYTSINTKEGYIEFRSPGGDWLGEYAADPGKLKNTLLRFVVALDVAMKPEAFRQEYMKKLYKTLSPEGSDDTIQFFARYAAGELPTSALKAFVKNAQEKRKTQKKEPTADTPSVAPAQSGTALPPVDFNGNYEVYAVGSGNSVYRFRVDSTAEAYNMLQRWRSSMMHPNLDPREYNVRAVIVAPQQAAPQQAAPAATAGLRPGYQRWLILDKNDYEVYSFVNTMVQSDANQYARNWMINTAPADVRDRGPFTIVPAR